jgi:hypothetical protein
MNNSEKVLRIASQYYTSRRTLKSLYKDEFPSKVKWYKDVLFAIMKKHNIECLPASVEAIKMIADKDGSGIGIMWFMAAAVEIIEPENN